MASRKYVCSSVAVLLLHICIVITNSTDIIADSTDIIPDSTDIIPDSTDTTDTINYNANNQGECPAECECQLRTRLAVENTSASWLVVKCRLEEHSLDFTLREVPVNTTHFYLSGGHIRVKSIPHGSFRRFKNLKVLEIIALAISGLSNETFAGLESLETLIVKDNKNLQYLGSCVFCPLRNLRTLSFWNCYRLSLRLSASDVPKALCGLNKFKIETLILHRINKVEYKGSSYFFPKYLQCLQGSSLKNLDLSYNWISLVHPGLPNILPYIEYLSVSQNNIIGRYEAGFELFKLTKLKVLVLTYQNLYWDTFYDGDLSSNGDDPAFMDRRNRYTDTLQVGTKVIDEHIAEVSGVEAKKHRKPRAMDPYCSLPFNLPLPRSLTEVKINNFRPGLEIQRGICFGENLLRKLNVANANIPIFRGPVKGFDNLIELDMRDNLFGVREDIARDAFYFIPSLRILLLGNNNLGRGLANDTEGLTFSQLPNLEVLDISRNNIISFSANLFRGLPKLKTLNISGNKIVSFDVDFNPNPLLVEFDLSKNELHSLSTKNRNSLDKLHTIHGHLLNIDLNDNEFICSCTHESNEYLKWFKDTKSFLKSYDKYQCYFSEDGATYRISTLDIVYYRNVCDYMKIVIIKMIAGFISFGIVIAIVAKLIHYYRWRIRYWNFAFKQLWKRHRYKRYIEGHEVKYDAFVSFQNDDLNWVRNELCKHIEDTGDFKLCIHHRDFLVGEYILDNIVTAIQNSRQTIIVVSEKYLNSNYTHFELQMAYSMMIDKGVDVIIAVLLDPIEDLLRHPKMTSTLKRLLMQKTYIQWETHGFWDRLKLKLNDQNRSLSV